MQPSASWGMDERKCGPIAFGPDPCRDVRRRSTSTHPPFPDLHTRTVPVEFVQRIPPNSHSYAGTLPDSSVVRWSRGVARPAEKGNYSPIHRRRRGMRIPARRRVERSLPPKFCSERTWKRLQFGPVLIFMRVALFLSHPVTFLSWKPRHRPRTRSPNPRLAFSAR